MTPRHMFWVCSNLWGWALGWPWLAPLHRTILNLSLHALGHDNARFTGETWFIHKVLKSQDTRVCIDVGANVGRYSAKLIEQLDCVVYAIEPLSSSFSGLVKQSQSFPEKLLPFKVALSDHIGTGVIRAKSPLSEKATLSHDGEGLSIEEEIQITTLDQFVKEKNIQHIDFIKIDTEGFEREVLRGMKNTLLTAKPKYIQFEFNINQLREGYTVLDLSKLLSGYTLYRLLPRGWIRIDPNTFAGNIFMFQNIVAMRDGGGLRT